MAEPRIENAHVMRLVEMAKEHGQVVISNRKNPEEKQAIAKENEYMRQYGVAYSFNEEGYLILKKI